MPIMMGWNYVAPFFLETPALSRYLVVAQETPIANSPQLCNISRNGGLATAVGMVSG
jgi:hypothetical protein